MERTLVTIAKCFVFKIPPSSVAGHKAKEWPTDPVWSGRLRVHTKDSKCFIYLENADGDGVFAQTEYKPHSVEAVIDSSRYFAVKFEDGKGHTALLGVGFNTRDEAFDFKVGLQDYENGTQTEERVKEAVADLGPAMDFSLPENATIKVNFKTKTSAQRKSTSSGASSGGGLFALAPPPDKPKKKSKKKKSSKKDANPDDLFGLADAFAAPTVGTSTTSSTAAKTTTTAATSKDDDPFAAFDANF